LAAAPGAGFGGTRRQVLEARFYENWLLLPMQTPQTELNWFLIYTRSNLVEQTTPAHLFVIDFCENIPQLINNTVAPEQGVQLLDAVYHENLLLMTFEKVTSDGFELEIISLRKGKLWMFVTTVDLAVMLTSTHVTQLLTAIGGPGCSYDELDVVSCYIKKYVFTGCNLVVGGAVNYRVYAMVVGDDDNVVDIYPAYIDFFVASNYFLYGPSIVERSERKIMVLFQPSHDGVLWIFLASKEDGKADFIGPRAEEYFMRDEPTILKVKMAGGPFMEDYLYGEDSCRLTNYPVTANYQFRAELTKCNMVLGDNYRLFMYIENTAGNNDGTLKTFDFTYVGIITLDGGIPFSMPVPSSEMWRVSPIVGVDKEWKVLKFRFFSDIACTKAVAIYPAPYSDPFESSLTDDDPSPNGAAFSLPGPLPRAAYPLVDGEAIDGWTSGRPCEPGECHFGFSFGNAAAGADRIREYVQVGCVEVVQSDMEGEFAEGLSLEYYKPDVGFVTYRTVMGLDGGRCFVPQFNASPFSRTPLA